MLLTDRQTQDQRSRVTVSGLQLVCNLTLRPIGVNLDSRLHNVVDRQTDRQTDKQTQVQTLPSSFAKVTEDHEVWRR